MDDVQFLKENCTKESYIFVVDSKDRDKEVYPSPNEYAIKFSSPFKNVYSLEILDASIPRTHYTIEDTNNKLYYNIDGGDYKLITIDIGNYSHLSMIEELNNKFESNISVSNLSSPADKRNQYIFSSTKPFSFDIKNSTIGDILGFEEYNNVVNDLSYTKGSNNQIFSSVNNSNTHTIIPPGMYSFVGDRYVMLKCKEIEDHLFHSRSFEKYSLGLAKFKLGVFGYGDERFDFSNIPPREFHPLGKLDFLTFRFEKPDGTLYNFRGINHTLTVVIRYYVNKPMSIFETSKLNPNYHPNFRNWWIENQYQNDSDTESESDSDTESDS